MLRASLLGLSPRRARWLLSCPANTGWGKTRSNVPKVVSPDHNLQKVNGLVYFRMRREGRDVLIRLFGTIEDMRRERDRLLAIHSQPQHHEQSN